MKYGLTSFYMLKNNFCEMIINLIYSVSPIKERNSQPLTKLKCVARVTEREEYQLFIKSEIFNATLVKKNIIKGCCKY